MMSAESLYEQEIAKLRGICDTITGLELSREDSYFSELSKIKGFWSTFGYLNSDETEAFDLSKLLERSVPFSVALRNICYRRTFFYLSKLAETIREVGDSNPKLHILLDHFRSYRRIERSFSSRNYRFEVLKAALDSGQAHALAPFYETVVDPELFTTLLHLAACNGRSLSGMREKLLNRLELITSSYISDDCNLRESALLRAEIMDAGNVFWALAALYHDRQEEFSLQGRHVGHEGFEGVFLALLERPALFGNPLAWRHPTEGELVLESTPEIYTAHKTGLYVLFNLLEVLTPHPALTPDFATRGKESATALIDKYVTGMKPPCNLYFTCLRIQCMRRFLRLWARDDDAGHDHGPAAKDGRRFAVALSFAGEYRDRIEQVANRLAATFSRERILYDAFHTAELARVNDADLYLQRLYSEHSQLIAVFCCKEYNKKPWCGIGVEWRVLRDLINRGCGYRIMVFSLDGTMPDGLQPTTDIFVDASRLAPDAIVEVIVDRYRLG